MNTSLNSPSLFGVRVPGIHHWGSLTLLCCRLATGYSSMRHGFCSVEIFPFDNHQIQTLLPPKNVSLTHCSSVLLSQRRWDRWYPTSDVPFIKLLWHLTKAGEQTFIHCLRQRAESHRDQITRLRLHRTFVSQPKNESQNLRPLLPQCPAVQHRGRPWSGSKEFPWPHCLWKHHTFATGTCAAATLMASCGFTSCGTFILFGWYPRSITA